MAVIEAIYQRRSVRDYKPDAVPPEVIDALVAAAVHAPSAMNLQPWAFIVVEGRESLSRYGERAKRYLIATMSPDSPLSRYRDQLSDPAFDIFYGAPALIVVAATSNAPQSAEDCCMAAQNLMLAACGMGLGSCCIGFARPWLNLRETKSELGIPEPYIPVVPIVVGYPGSAAPRVPRRLPEVYRVSTEGNPPAGCDADTAAALQPKGWEFEEPAATEAREDPGTNVAPGRHDAPLDPQAPIRTSSPECCGPPADDP
jgi:nitroreductase